MLFTGRNRPQCHLYLDAETPGAGVYAGSYEVGGQFTVDVPGTVTRLRMWHKLGDTTAHTGHLWAPTAALLASAVFPPMTGEGWNEVAISPVSIVPGTVYKTSYSNVGTFADEPGYFNVAKDNPPLHAPVQAGCFGLPNNYPTYVPGANDSYWADVTFVPN